MGSAFTTSGTTKLNTLKNEVTIQYNGKEIQVVALWDTGATNTCISQKVVQDLSLIATGKATMTTPSSQADERNTYLVGIVLPNNVKVNDHVVIDSDIDNQNIGMLIGMDIITMGDFSVSNFNNQTIFTFRIPSECKTDYVQEIRISKLVGQKHGKGKRKRK